MSQPADGLAPSPTDLDQLLTIHAIFTRASHWKPALDQIVPLLRKIFIFDNLVLYLPDPANKQFEVAYARVVGRGRSVGPDINWGESIANQVYRSGKMTIQEPPSDPEISERLNQPYLLAFPVKNNETTAGSLVFIRFGGPAYTESDKTIAGFLADGVSQLIRYQDNQQKLQVLEAERKQSQLQEDFISTISHELLTPLGFIKGYTTTLLRADASWDENSQREFLNIIDEETDRLQELIDNLLDSSRLQSGTLRMTFQPVRLDALLKDVMMRSRQHHRNLNIKLDFSEPSTPIQGDPRRLAQVFENLIGNVVKYAPGSEIFMAIVENKNDVHITVQDFGPGIPSQYVPHLFERFFRNPEQAPNVRGTGLGLFICRQIIEAHRGRIEVESELGEGTTIHIYLPYKQTGFNRRRNLNMDPKTGG